MFYALAPIALIGGSLVTRGGQNPMEAIKLGAAVLTGPNWQNFPDTYTDLLKTEGAKEVSDATSLAEAVLHLLQDTDARQAMTATATTAIAAMGGALPRTIEALDPYLPPKVTP
jgi:3-deoxy-D-manno-octulosonic-acid transferase